ncbi:hypothetical protein D1818_05645 [Aquimarina sp. BL5]|uniref:hypothetical protein n=1 Tax=Aquimarina sp. BL5 TaxID=1714860 RepID=UPI000E541F9A|nr:hypothetical protein [Aquimarina sp. BL5]AXT50335.1 hypothetical protein D1818_05645 [Aquimarina sp. BL5]RKM92116.1 hypothetical protein D7036_22990 [Aquimarina sp. BL5]
MEKRKKISVGIAFKKYFLSWFTILVLFIITKLVTINSLFLLYAVWALAILFSILCISLKKVEFTSDIVYFGGKAFNYSLIKDLKIFEFNKDTFYLFITESDNVFSKYHFTQLGFGKKIGYLGILRMLYSKTLDKKIPLAEFLELLEEKSEIKKKLN